MSFFRRFWQAFTNPYVDCLCPGCPKRIPQAWESGMCTTCEEEDCLHTEGARDMAARLRVCESAREAAEGRGLELEKVVAFLEGRCARMDDEQIAAAIVREQLDEALTENAALASSYEQHTATKKDEHEAMLSAKQETANLRALLRETEEALRAERARRDPTPSSGEGEA